MLLACHSYVSVCTRMLRVCDSYVFVGTRIYPRVDRMLPVALVWCFSHDHAEWSSNFQLFSWSQRTGIRFLARGVGGCRLISFLFIFFLVLQWEYFQKLISTSEKMWSSAFRLGESVYYEQWYYFMNVYIIFCIYNVDGGSEIEPFFKFTFRIYFDTIEKIRIIFSKRWRVTKIETETCHLFFTALLQNAFWISALKRKKVLSL